MIFSTLENINFNELQVLDGSFYCKNKNLIHIICDKVKYIFCRLYYRLFSIDIIKTKEKLKIKIFAVGISKDLIYFLNDLPNNIDVLEIPELVLNEVLSNLPINLKKLVIINYNELNIHLINNLLKCKIPNDTKVVCKIKNTTKFAVDLTHDKLKLIST
jgi:hypothetical protein